MRAGVSVQEPHEAFHLVGDLRVRVRLHFEPLRGLCILSDEVTEVEAGDGDGLPACPDDFLAAVRVFLLADLLARGDDL